MSVLLSLAVMTLLLLVLSKQRYGRVWWSFSLPLIVMVVTYIVNAPVLVRASWYVVSLVTVVVIRWLAAWRRGIKNKRKQS
ncbi:MAG: hypothetical protein H6797_04090 [Candidatus Nomurabacteria bacterium]|nr:MAG: hypothetical protein H6797_04090 [Candidatus Nomurabacteria bacterium]